MVAGWGGAAAGMHHAKLAQNNHPRLIPLRGSHRRERVKQVAISN
jgi:hypothetical protein